MAKIDKKLVKNLYISGLNAQEIARMLNFKFKSDSIKKCIERNCSLEDKIKHKKLKIEKREIKKAINYESTKCMSDSTFIKRNPSIYKTRENGDIVVNAPEEFLPWDVPRILKNDNSKELYEKRVTKKYRDVSEKPLN
ncbi:hypothetical protein [Clostridium beijerinckii]|uniref:hypothetical protein n=1 Tax=Clostridium beijerinckii TaxID=1520 RepID=UPI0003D32323|nr:hypothetical protein [Clostridium beijerinckii]